MTSRSYLVKLPKMTDNRGMNETAKESADIAPIGRRARKALAVRQALFDAGLEAFERQPISMVSVLDITERADVAKGVFYLQFKSKDAYLLALWEEVQARFLDSARAMAVGHRAQSARLESTVNALLQFMREKPAATRFWLRIAGYFTDEIGEPGHLTRIHQSYVQKIATLITGKTIADLSEQDLLMAQLVDTIGWAQINAELQLGEPLLDVKRLVKAIKAAASPVSAT